MKEIKQSKDPKAQLKKDLDSLVKKFKDTDHKINEQKQLESELEIKITSLNKEIEKFKANIKNTEESIEKYEE